MSETTFSSGHRTQRTLVLIVAAFLCGPLAGVCLATLASGGIGLLVAPKFILFGAVYGAVFGLPAVAVIGLPAHSFAYRRRLHGLRWYLAAAVPAALFTYATHVFVVEVFGNGFVGLRWWNVLYFGAFHLAAAMIAACIFWLIRRPDRDEKRGWRAS